MPESDAAMEMLAASEVIPLGDGDEFQFFFGRKKQDRFRVNADIITCPS